MLSLLTSASLLSTLLGSKGVGMQASVPVSVVCVCYVLYLAARGSIEGSDRIW